MNTQELYRILHSKGFDVENTSFGVIVSLNRRITFQEIEEALDHAVDQVHYVRIDERAVFVPSEE